MLESLSSWLLQLIMAVSIEFARKNSDQVRQENSDPSVNITLQSHQLSHFVNLKSKVRLDRANEGQKITT